MGTCSFEFIFIHYAFTNHIPNIYIYIYIYICGGYYVHIISIPANNY